MAESKSASEVLPYRFDHCLFQIIVIMKIYSSNESETDIREQASFMEQLWSTNWWECMKCTIMLSGIECQCCREMESVVKRIADSKSY